MEHSPPERPLYEQRERAPHDPAQDEQGSEIEGAGMIRPDTERPPDPQEADEEPAAPKRGRRTSARPRRSQKARGGRAVKTPRKRQGRKTLSRKSARKTAAARKRRKALPRQAKARRKERRR